MAHHGVALVQADNGLFELIKGDAHVACKSGDLLILGGKELMEGRIQEADRNGTTLHCLVDALEVFTLHGQNFCKSSLALIRIL